MRLDKHAVDLIFTNTLFSSLRPYIKITKDLLFLSPWDSGLDVSKSGLAQGAEFLSVDRWLRKWGTEGRFIGQFR